MYMNKLDMLKSRPGRFLAFLIQQSVEQRQLDPCKAYPGTITVTSANTITSSPAITPTITIVTMTTIISNIIYSIIYNIITIINIITITCHMSKDVRRRYQQSYYTFVCA